MSFIRPGRSQGPTQIGVKIDKAAFEKADAELVKLPFELRSKVVVQAVRAAAKAYQVGLTDEISEHINSELTDSREKQSKKLKAKRPAHHLYETVVIKLGPYAQSEVAVVGPSWPSGNLINFFVSHYTHPSWGKDPQIAVRPIAVDLAARVAESTKGQQESQFVGTMIKQTAKQLAKLKKNTPPSS